MICQTDLHNKNKFHLKLLTLEKFEIKAIFFCIVCVDTRTGLEKEIFCLITSMGQIKNSE